MTGRERLTAAIRSAASGSDVDQLAAAILAWLDAHPDPQVERATVWRIARDTPRSRTWIDAGEPGVLTTAGEARIELEAQRNYDDAKAPGQFTAVRVTTLTRKAEEPW